LNSVSKLICVADGGVTPRQIPLFKLVTGLPAASSLLLPELICRCIFAEQSLDVDGATPAPTSVKQQCSFNASSRLRKVK